MLPDPNVQPFGEAPLPPTPAETMGRVLPFPGMSAVSPSETPATRLPRARKAPKPKERKYWLKDAIKGDMSLPLRARIIGADLAEMCDINEECAFLSHATLMKRNGMKLDTVKRALHDLDVEDKGAGQGKGAGYFAREFCTGPSGQNKYRPNWEKIGLQGSTMRQRFDVLPGERLSPVSDDKAAPGGSAAVRGGGVQPCTP